MQIQVTYKSVYGVDRYYPSNKLSEIMLDYKGAKTFTQSELAALALGGFTIDCTNEPSRSLPASA